MNSIVTGSIQKLTETSSADSIVNNHRVWSTEQDGPNDKTVDIWHEGRWVPAYFKDIKAWDFFLMIEMNLEPGKCFLAKSPAIKMGVWNGHRTYMVKDGMEIVQAPALKEINPAKALPNNPPLLKE